MTQFNCDDVRLFNTRINIAFSFYIRLPQATRAAQSIVTFCCPMTSTCEPVELDDAVRGNIISRSERGLVASAAKIGAGGYGEIYKIGVQKSTPTDEADCNWVNPFRV